MNKGIVYVFTNKNNGMQYYGRTIRPDLRFMQHLNAELGKHNTYDYFHEAIREIGCQGNLDEFFKHFDFEVLDTLYYNKENKAEISKELDLLESKYIKDNNSIWPNGYNDKSYSNTKIFSLTPEQIEKSKANKNKTNKNGSKKTTRYRVKEMFFVTEEDRQLVHERRSAITKKAMQEYFSRPEQIAKKEETKIKNEKKKLEKAKAKEEYWNSEEGKARKQQNKDKTSKIITEYNKSEAHRQSAIESNKRRWENGCPEETREKFRIKARLRQCKELTEEQQKIYVSIDSAKERREFKNKCLNMI